MQTSMVRHIDYSLSLRRLLIHKWGYNSQTCDVSAHKYTFLHQWVFFSKGSECSFVRVGEAEELGWTRLDVGQCAQRTEDGLSLCLSPPCFYIIDSLNRIYSLWFCPAAVLYCFEGLFLLSENLKVPADVEVNLCQRNRKTQTVLENMKMSPAASEINTLENKSRF